MTTTRKLQTEIDRVLKKIQEGIEEFDQIWEKVHNAPTPNLKEKYESDLKKEIKKLQRHRDQLKSWASNNDVKNKKPLLDGRRLIETKMEQFKVLEKETKTKAYSKEGLNAAMRKEASKNHEENGPKQEMLGWIDEFESTLQDQVSEMEDKLEALKENSENTSKGKKKGGTSSAEAELQHWIDRHNHHLKQTVEIRSRLEDDEVTADQVAEIKEMLEYYLENHQEPDFQEDETIYDGIDLDTKRKTKKKKDDSDEDGDDDEDGTGSDNEEEEAEEEAEEEEEDTKKKSPALKGVSGKTIAASKVPASPRKSSTAGLPTSSASSSSTSSTPSKSVSTGTPKPTSKPSPVSSSAPAPVAASKSATPSTPSSSSISSTRPPTAVPSTAASKPAIPAASTTTGIKPPPTIRSTSTPVSTTPITGVRPTAPAVPAATASSSSSAASIVKAPATATTPINAATVAAGAKPVTKPGEITRITPAPKTGPTPTPVIATAPAYSKQSTESLASILSKQNKAAEAAKPTAAPPAPSQPPPLVTSPSASPTSTPLSGPKQSPGAVTPTAAPATTPKPATTAAATVAAAAAVKKTKDITPTSTAPTTPSAIKPVTTVPSTAPPTTSSPTSGAKSAPTPTIAASAKQQQQQQQQQSMVPSVTAGVGLRGQTPSPSVSEQGGSVESSMGTSISSSSSTPSPSPPPNGSATQSMLNPPSYRDRGLVSDDYLYNLHLLEASRQFIPDPSDSDRATLYIPRNPYRTPNYFPSVPASIFESPSSGIFEKFGPDTLFFIFYFQQGTPHQYLAARELKKQSWRYHKNFLTWFQRHDDPTTTTDEYEQGTYIYFDYESGWCQRIKTDFTFEYKHLEDDCFRDLTDEGVDHAQ